jgi:hypothetical protein
MNAQIEIRLHVPTDTTARSYVFPLDQALLADLMATAKYSDEPIGRLFDNQPQQQYADILARRRNAANYVAKQVVNFMLHELAKTDTINGYTKKESEELSERG